MTQHVDPRRIEQDIDRDRASLASTLDALQERVSVENVAQEAFGFLRTNSASYAKSIDEAVRANPIALALVGVGLAWLVFGTRKSSDPVKTKLEAMSGWEDDGGPARPSDELQPSWSETSDGLRRKASDTLHRLEREARGATAGLRDFAAERAAVVAEFTEGLRQSFRQGLEGLTEMAQDKIVAVREAAYSAKHSVERMKPRSTGEMIEDHPMLSGAVLMALGAALGAALPRSAMEDRAFGAERDRLMEQAARMLAEERDAMLRVAGDIKADLVGTAQDAMTTVADSVAKMGDTVSGKLADAGNTL